MPLYQDKMGEVQEIVRRLTGVHPDIKTSLHHTNPFELLISTILSAQCTDERVNLVTKKLFKEYRTPSDFASASLKSLEAIIKPTGYFHSKARYIKETSKQIVDNFRSNVPDTMEELLQLPGVGRKTANVVLTVAYSKHEGIAVDTHVQRLAKRLGLAESNGPEKIEEELMQNTPKHLWGKLTILLILHGREVCSARSPECSKCVLNDICPSAFCFETEYGKKRS